MLDNMMMPFVGKEPEITMESLLGSFEHLLEKMTNLKPEDKGTLMLGFYSGAATASNLIGQAMLNREVPLAVNVQWAKLMSELGAFMEVVAEMGRETEKEAAEATKH